MPKMRLRNRFLKEATLMNRLAYEKQRNYLVSLVRENKKHGSLNVNDITDNKKFWRVIKVRPSPSKKISVICLVESPLKMMKNVFYFILKGLFVLKIFKFLSRHFGHEGLIRTAWLERHG